MGKNAGPFGALCYFVGIASLKQSEGDLEIYLTLPYVEIIFSLEETDITPELCGDVSSY